MTTDSYATDQHDLRLKRYRHLQSRPLSLYQVPDLRLIHHHPDFPDDADCSDLWSWATSFRRMRYDEHPDAYESAFIARWIRGHPADRDDMEFDDWFETQPAVTQNSLRERQRMSAAGAVTLPPVYYPPRDGRTELDGQERLALD